MYFYVLLWKFVLPLYCTHCCLTLLSPIVVLAHYFQSKDLTYFPEKTGTIFLQLISFSFILLSKKGSHHLQERFRSILLPLLPSNVAPQVILSFALDLRLQLKTFRAHCHFFYQSFPSHCLVDGSSFFNHLKRGLNE